MNKKGFAISVILYSMVILIVGILYLLLGLVRNRYTVLDKYRNAVRESVDFHGANDDLFRCWYFDYSIIGKIGISNYLCEEESVDITIPSQMGSQKITFISDSGLRGNGIESVKIPNTITSIGEEAFSYNKLVELNLPNSLVTIEADSFAGNQLTRVVIPDSVKVIGEYAFMENYLTEVVIGTGVEEIGLGAFGMITKWGYIQGNKIIKIVNKTGREFDWGSILGAELFTGDTTFVTGELTYYDPKYGINKTIVITDN